jgi:hypothetical protein
MVYTKTLNSNKGNEFRLKTLCILYNQQSNVEMTAAATVELE